MAKFSLSKFLLKWSSVLALSLLVCELSLRVWGFEPTYSIKVAGLPEEYSSLRITLDRERLYRIKPWPKKSINSWGFRDVEFGRKQKNVFRIVVVGDTFPMGLAVAPPETFPKKLGQLLGPSFEVLNLGIQGYGPDQELSVLENEGLALQPDLVIWSIFPGNDFSDVVKNQLYEFSSSGQLDYSERNYIAVHVPSARLLSALNVIWYGSFLKPETEKNLDAAFFQDQVHILTDPKHPWRAIGVPMIREILRRGKRLLQQQNIPVVGVFIPSYEIIQNDERLRKEGIPQRYYATNELLASEIMRDVGIPFADLTPIFERARESTLFTEEERHLSSRGHELVAQSLLNLLRREKLISSLRVNPQPS